MDPVIFVSTATLLVEDVVKALSTMEQKGPKCRKFSEKIDDLQVQIRLSAALKSDELKNVESTFEPLNGWLSSIKVFLRTRTIPITDRTLSGSFDLTFVELADRANSYADEILYIVAQSAATSSTDSDASNHVATSLLSDQMTSSSQEEEQRVIQDNPIPPLNQSDRRTEDPHHHRTLGAIGGVRLLGCSLFVAVVAILLMLWRRSHAGATTTGATQRPSANCQSFGDHGCSLTDILQELRTTNTPEAMEISESAIRRLLAQTGGCDGLFQSAQGPRVAAEEGASGEGSGDGWEQGKSERSEVRCAGFSQQAREVSTSDIVAVRETLSPMLKLLRGESLSMKLMSTAALGSLSRDPRIREVIRTTAGLIPLLVRFLTNKEAGEGLLQQEAAQVLFHLAKDADARPAIAANAAIPPLVRLLRTGTELAKESAAGVLGHLAENIVLARVIGAAGAIYPLVQMLRSESFSTRNRASTALENLSQVPDLRRRVLQEGGILPMTHLFESHTGVLGDINNPERMNLTNLVRYMHKTKYFRSGGGIFSMLEDQLRSDNPADTKIAALMFIEDLGQTSEGAALVAQSGILHTMVRVAADQSEIEFGKEQVRGHALSALFTFVIDRVSKRVLKAMGAIGVFRELYRGVDDRIQRERDAGTYIYSNENADDENNGNLAAGLMYMLMSD